jgi:hypothetical protein
MLTLINQVVRAEPFDHPDWLFEGRAPDFAVRTASRVGIPT